MTKETLNTNGESRRARLERKTVQYWKLKRESECAVRSDKKAQVRGDCETVESHLWSIDSRPAWESGQRNLDVRSSSPPPCCSTVKAADGTTLAGESEIWARWAGKFEELYRVDSSPVVTFPGMLALSEMRTLLLAVIHPP